MTRVAILASAVFVAGAAGAAEPLVIDHHDPLLRLLMAHPQQRFAVAAEIVTHPDLVATEDLRERASVSPMKHLFRASKTAQAALEFVLRKRGSEAVAPHRRSPEAAPNVVLIVVDALPDVETVAGSDGGSAVPHLGRLAAEGAYSPAAAVASHASLVAAASLLTGVPPEQHGLPFGAVRGEHRLERSVPTLAEALSQSGLDTVGFFSHPTLDGVWGLGRGFDLYEGRRLGSAVALVAHARLWLDWHSFHAARGLEPEAFFLFLQLRDLRVPEAAPAPYLDRYDDPAIAALRAVDDQIGVLVQSLETFGVLDDTILVVMGSPTGTSGTDDAATTVPLMVRYPARVPAALRLAGDVSTTRVKPTLAAWVRGEPVGDDGLPISGD